MMSIMGPISKSPLMCILILEIFVTFSVTDSTDQNGTVNPPIMPARRAVIHILEPSYGPVSGGTPITIIGVFWDMLDAHTEIWFGENLKLNITHRDIDSHKIMAITPPYRDDWLDVKHVQFNVSITYNNSTQEELIFYTDQPFTYRPDPEVVDIYPRKMIKSGGTTVTVKGYYLDSVSRPMLTITAFKRSIIRQTFQSPCRHDDKTSLICVTPNIPDNLLESKTERHTTNRHRRENSYDDIDFILGLQLDGVVDYEDLTDNLPRLAHLEVHHDPTFNSDQVFRYDPESGSVIGITGDKVDAGVVVADYEVRIGKGFCTNIGILSNRLYCNPPLTLDEVLDEYNTAKTYNGADVMVRVGAYLEYAVGYIVYDKDECVPMNTVFVPVVVALGALLLLCVIILMVSCYRKRRNKNDPEKPTSTSAEE